MHKGFKCLDLAKGRKYISRDVIFNESVFPFPSLHSNASAHYHFDVLLQPGNDITTIMTDIPNLSSVACF
jgi:hypothetical protein